MIVLSMQRYELQHEQNQLVCGQLSPALVTYGSIEDSIGRTSCALLQCRSCNAAGRP